MTKLRLGFFVARIVIPIRRSRTTYPKRRSAKLTDVEGSHGCDSFSTLTPEPVLSDNEGKGRISILDSKENAMSPGVDMESCFIAIAFAGPSC